MVDVKAIITDIEIIIEALDNNDIRDAEKMLRDLREDLKILLLTS